MIKTEPIQVFQCFEQVKLLVSVHEDSWVRGQQVGEWTSARRSHQLSIRPSSVLKRSNSIDCGMPSNEEGDKPRTDSMARLLAVIESGASDTAFTSFYGNGKTKFPLLFGFIINLSY